jgi:hypothetical protein
MSRAFRSPFRSGTMRSGKCREWGEAMTIAVEVLGPRTVVLSPAWNDISKSSFFAGFLMLFAAVPFRAAMSGGFDYELMITSSVLLMVRVIILNPVFQKTVDVAGQRRIRALECVLSPFWQLGLIIAVVVT